MRHSEISSYYTCPKLYQLDYIDKLPRKGELSSALTFGTHMHAGLEAILAGENGQDVFEMLWTSHKDTPMTYYGRESWASLLDDGARLLDLFKNRHLKHINPKFVETALSGAYKDIMLEGTLDCAGEYKGVPSVIDFKTSGSRYLPEKLVVSEQLYLYNNLLRVAKNFKAVQHVYIVLRKTGRDGEAGIQVINKKVNDAELEHVLDNLQAVAIAMKATKTFTMNRNSCIIANKYKCSRFDICYKKEQND